MSNTTSQEVSSARLVEINLDSKSIDHQNINVEHEREVAIFDILENNSFKVVGHEDGPYKLLLAIVESRLVFEVSTNSNEAIVSHLLSLTPFRRTIKDYFAVCETYYDAIRTAPPSKIQAIDMGRRGLHDDGSRILMERLAGKIEVDFDTARRLFTLICALHWKG